MTSGSDISGRCLCGAVRFAARVTKLDVGVCHCGMCQRWTGGPFLAIEHEGAVAIEGQGNVSIYRSSDWGERAFCRVCGTTLFWKMHGAEHYALSAGAVDDRSGLRLLSEIFIDEKPAYYDFANNTQKLTGAEFIAAFTGQAKE